MLTRLRYRDIIKVNNIEDIEEENQHIWNGENRFLMFAL